MDDQGNRRWWLRASREELQKLANAALDFNTTQAAGLAEFRADGWPLCPICGEDELWSPLIWEEEPPALAAFIAAGLRCYKCGWSKERTVNAAQMSPPGLETPQTDR